MYHQISVYDLLKEPEPQNRFVAVLKRGSGFAGGKVRIYAASKTVSDFKRFLQEEYGIGGHSVDYRDGGTGFVDYNSRGLILREWKTDWQEKKTWAEAEKEIRELIDRWEYLTDKEWATVGEIKRRHGGILPAPAPRLRYE